MLFLRVMSRRDRMRIEAVFQLRRIALLFGFLGLVAQGALSAEADDEEVPQWQEQDIQLPNPPTPDNLQAFYVSAASDNQFLIDLSTVSVGSDGVVRYVLVVLTAGGSRNVTFEGMRCETRERRIYASGRRDGAWSKSRNDGWSRIQDVNANRHHAALFLEYFCPGGVVVRDAAEAIGALKRGGHPINKAW